MEYEDYEDGYGVPDMVKQFVVYFYRHIRERNIREIHSMFTVSFPTLSERFFKDVPWPLVTEIAELAENDHVFCLLYQEMYFRHLFAIKGHKPSLQQRVAAWDNYCQLFGVILHGNVNMQLPHSWLWDMVDEFVYQFQSFCQYKGKLGQMHPEDVDALRNLDGVWNVLAVLNYLQAMVDKSGILAELSSEDSQKRLFETEGYDPKESNVLRMLGYFSLMGLLRVHTVIGDYYGALKAVYPASVFQTKNLFATKQPGCNITLHYYVGFCYLMMQRYVDAARTFNNILSWIARTRHVLSQHVHFDEFLKKNEQIYALLALVVAFCPPATKVLEETVSNQLREKYQEKMQRMAGRMEEPVFQELFDYGCPRFITTAPPNFDSPALNSNMEAYRTQLRMILGAVQEQKHVPVIRQFLKLYSSIPLSKLAHLMEVEEATLRAQLLVLKKHTVVKTHAGSGDLTQGEAQPTGDVQFYIDVDPSGGDEMVHVAEAAPPKRRADFLVRHIAKFEQIVSDLNQTSMIQQRSAAAPSY